MQAQADPRTAALVDSLQLTGSGKTVALSFSVPAEILEMIPKAADSAGWASPLTRARVAAPEKGRLSNRRLNFSCSTGRCESPAFWMPG